MCLPIQIFSKIDYNPKTQIKKIRKLGTTITFPTGLGTPLILKFVAPNSLDLITKSLTAYHQFQKFLIFRVCEIIPFN